MFARRIALQLPRRAFSSLSRPPVSRKHKVAIASGAALTVTLALHHLPSPHADDLASVMHHPLQQDVKPDASTSLAALVRTYAVYSMCSVPFLVDHAPNVLTVLRSIPGVRHLTDAFVRATFFSQFVGGDTAQEAIPLLHRLRAENKGALFAYSVESDESETTDKSSPTHADAQPHRRRIEEIIRCIDVAADFEDGYPTTSLGSANFRKTWVAVKITALVPDANTLVAASTYILRRRPKDIAFPGFPTVHDLNIIHDSEAQVVSSNGVPRRGDWRIDIQALRELHTDLVRICNHAAKRGVKIIIDAEHSWYQPAVDALAHSLMRQFNKLPDNELDARNKQTVQPLVYTTCQAYLRRAPKYLEEAIRDAKSNNYALGVKLVRGAYHMQEIAAHSAAGAENVHASFHRSQSISPESQPPVWPTKDLTDTCYNDCAKILMGLVKEDIQARSHFNVTPAVGVIFATHNWKSCNLILDELANCGLGSRVSGKEGEVMQLSDAAMERIALAQLYGMSDALTDYLVGTTRSTSPFVIKYIPYGALSEVIPYLGRRAIENKSVLGHGAASEERKRAWAAIRQRLLG